MPLKNPEARRAYHREYMRKRYAEDPEFKAKHAERVRKNDAKRLQQISDLILEWKRRGCENPACAETDPCCLVAHHVDSDRKNFTIALGKKRKLSISAIKNELTLCICLCSNCHAKVHAGVLILDHGVVQQEER